MNLSAKSSIVVLTGAGISAESGLKTFRDSGGLWENQRVEDVATPEGFQRNPELVHQFYNERRAQLQSARPNPAHDALARLEQHWPGEFLLVTQNVDDLHERAGSRKLIHMHGELHKVRCLRCGAVQTWTGDTSPAQACPLCGRKGGLRPHIVWFGEMPLEMPRIQHALERCDLFLAVGTSGNVYPAAGFVDLTRPGTHTMELNLEPSLVSSRFKEKRQGPASITVPALVEQWLQGLKDE
ncbi:MAG: NAD-dependent protein deacylase [Holophaga sp.]|nr:NAD-dependent protein deacylase [Holophaga sp.]